MQFFPTPDQYVTFSFELWLPVFLWMMIGITFAILTRREDITMPSKVGKKIKPGTLGQYIITFCLSFFLQAFGVIPVAAGLYAGGGGTIANQLQKVVTTRMSQAEMEEKLREMIEDFENYKEYTKVIEDTRERKVMERLLAVLRKTPEEIGGVALKLLGLGETSKPLAEIGVEAIEEVIEHITKEEIVAESAQVDTPSEKMEMTIQEAKELLRKAKKKSIFRR
ncbi:MAG: hypothetical protein KKD44_27135 [Proteobacteria bacterium]|nr:hypothetical protein [Pseudomonadota bacterium]